MKKIYIIFSIVFLCTLLMANEPIAVSLKVQGEVELKRDDERQKAKTGDQLLNLDQLESKDESYAAVKFIDGSSVVKLFPNSILRIEAKQEDKEFHKKSYLQVGNMWTNVARRTGDFEVETPTTVVSVKGTKFLLEVTDSGTGVYTFGGEVSIVNKADGKRADVKAGQKAFSDGKTIEVSKTEKGDIDADVLADIEEEMNILRFEMENDEGELRTIEIEFE